MTAENLGPPVAWHIRSIPKQVREHYVDAANAQKVTVAEHLTRLAMSPGASTAGATAAPVDVERLHRLLESAALLGTKAGTVPRGIFSLGRDIVRAELERMRAAQAGWLMQPQLPATVPGHHDQVEDDQVEEQAGDAVAPAVPL